MRVFSKRRWINASVIGLATLLMIILVTFYATRDPPDIRRFLTIRGEWDRAAPAQAQEEFAERCLETAEKYPDTTGELAALYLAACRAPKTEPGQKARETFIARIANVDLSQLAKAIRYVHERGPIFILETPPDPRAMSYYHVYRDQGIVRALLDRLKRSPNLPRTAALLTLVCEMSTDSGDEEPTAQFTEAADLIASQYSTSPEIYNFCEILGQDYGGRSWPHRYERHLRTILNANQDRSVRFTALFALALVVESCGESRQAEAGKLYEEFLEKFDGQYQYPFQGIEQMYHQQATRRLEGLRLCGIGNAAPEIVGIDLEGQQMKLSDTTRRGQTGTYYFSFRLRSFRPRVSITCNTSGRVAKRRRFAPTPLATHSVVRADRAAAQVGQLRRQLHGDRLGTPDAPAVRREQPGIDAVMASNRLIDLLQRYRPPRQIEVFILQATAPALRNPPRPTNAALADRVAAGGHRQRAGARHPPS